MIIDGFVTWVLAMVQTVVEWFPEWGMNLGDEAGMWHGIAPAMSVLNGWLPIPTIFQCLLLWLSAEATYLVVLTLRWGINLIKGWL